MDLKELSHSRINRHPWETSRLNALKIILRPFLVEGIQVLDVGCGDGFISRNLFDHIRTKNITAVDVNLTDELILRLNNGISGITYQQVLPIEGIYDLILLLDVIEHVEHDQNFLANLVETYIPVKGKVMITVPAFQCIYSQHDTFLGHYRRYNLRDLIGLVTECRLKVLSSGYLFSSLLLPKFVLYRLINTGKRIEGVGNWNRGKFITKIVEKILTIENSLLISANRLGIKIPGLTGWVLCEKQD